MVRKCQRFLKWFFMKINFHFNILPLRVLYSVCVRCAVFDVKNVQYSNFIVAFDSTRNAVYFSSILSQWTRFKEVRIYVFITIEQQRSSRKKMCICISAHMQMWFKETVIHFLRITFASANVCACIIMHALSFAIVVPLLQMLGFSERIDFCFKLNLFIWFFLTDVFDCIQCKGFHYFAICKWALMNTIDFGFVFLHDGRKLMDSKKISCQKGKMYLSNGNKKNIPNQIV